MIRGSRLKFESRAGHYHQPATSVMIDTNSLTLLPLSRSYSQHSPYAVARLSVENDPKRTIIC